MTRRIAALVLALAFLAGCGGGSASLAATAPPIAPTPTLPPGTVVNTAVAVPPATPAWTATATATSTVIPSLAVSPTPTPAPPTPTPAPTPTAVPPAPTPAAASASSGTGAACRAGNPLANVYHAYRLRVLSPCKTATGVVVRVTHEPDGDEHVNLRLDAGEGSLINSQNIAREGGALVVEIVPADEPGCVVGQPPKPASGTYNYGTCTGADIPPPTVGAYIQVTGPYVLDADHGWLEIHPAWSIKVLNGGPAPVPTPTPTVAAAPAISGSTAASVTFTSVTGGRPGGTAAVSVKTAPGASCAISYVTPAGTHSTAAGLVGQTADGNGVASWSWRIGSSTRPGTGTVTVVCGGASASTRITIG